jgi:hypothetical protein
MVLIIFYAQEDEEFFIVLLKIFPFGISTLLVDILHLLQQGL